MGMPWVYNVGTVSAPTTGAATPGIPGGTVADDILLLFVEAANEPLNAITGFTRIGSTAVVQATGLVTDLSVFWKRAVGGDTAPSITATPQDHLIAQIVGVRGAINTGVPINVSATGVDNGTGTGFSIPGAVTTAPDCLVFAAVSVGTDITSTTMATGWANPSLTLLTERVDNWTLNGNGGGIAVASGMKAQPGAYAATTGTLTTGNTKAMMSFAVQGGTGLGGFPILDPSTPAQVFGDTVAATSLTTASFTPPSGSVIVASVVSGDSGVTHTTPAGFTSRGSFGAASNSRVSIFTAVGAGTPMTVTAAFTGSAARVLSVNVWTNAKLAASPAVGSASTTGAPSATVTTVAPSSIIDWASDDWTATDATNTRTYRSGASEDYFRFVSGQHTAYFAYQQAATPGAQTIGLTAPSQTYTIAGIEIQAATVAEDTGVAVAWTPQMGSGPSLTPGVPNFNNPMTGAAVLDQGLLVGQAAGNNFTNALTVPYTSKQGNLLAAVVLHQDITITSITDTASNTWVQAGDATTAGATTQGMVGIWYCANANAVTSITANGSGTSAIIVAVSEYSGLASAPRDVQVAYAAGVAASSPTLTPAALYGDVVLAGFGYFNAAGRSDSPPLDFMPLRTAVQTSTVMSVAYQMASAPSPSPSWTLTGSSSNRGVVAVAFPPAVAGQTQTATVGFASTSSLTVAPTTVRTAAIVMASSSVLGVISGPLTDQLNLSFTSQSMTSTYHVFAAGLDWTKPVGLLVYTDGSGAFGLDNPNDTYLLDADGNLGLVKVAKDRNLLLVSPIAPLPGDVDGDNCWYNTSTSPDGTAKASWSNDLINYIRAQYTIANNRVVIGGYSSGAQWTTEFFLPQFGESQSVDLAVAISFGGEPISTTSWTSPYKAATHVVWDVGVSDPAYNTFPGFDVQSGYDWYTTAGFQTKLVTHAGTHSRSDFMTVMAREIDLFIPSATTDVAFVSSSTLSVTPLVTHPATVALASSSSLAVTPLVTHPATVGFASSSALAVTATTGTTASVGFASSSTLGVAGTDTTSATPALVSTSTLAITALVTHPAVVAMASSSTLTVIAGSVVNAPDSWYDAWFDSWIGGIYFPGANTLSIAAAVGTNVALAQSSALGVGSLVTHPSAVGMASSSTLTVSAETVRTATVAIASTSTLTVTVAITQAATVAIAGAGILAVSGTQIQTGTVGLVSTSTLAVTATTGSQVTVAFVSSSALAVTATVSHPAVVAVAQSSSFTTTADVTVLAAVGFVSTSTLGVTGTVTGQFAVPFVSSSALSVAGILSHASAVGFVSTSTVTVVGTDTIAATVALVGSSALTVTIAVTHPYAVTLASTSTLAVTGAQTIPSSVTFASISTLGVTVSGSQFGAVAFAQTSALEVAAVVTHGVSVALVGGSALSVTTTVTRVSAIAFTGSNNLTLAGSLVHLAAVLMSSLSTLDMIATIGDIITHPVAAAGTAPSGPMASAGTAPMPAMARAGTA